MKKLIALFTALLLAASCFSVAAVERNSSKAVKKSTLNYTQKSKYTLIYSGSDSEPKEATPDEPPEATPDEPCTEASEPFEDSTYAPWEPGGAGGDPQPEQPTYSPLIPTKPLPTDSPDAPEATEPVTVAPTFAPATKNPNPGKQPTTAAPAQEDTTKPPKKSDTKIYEQSAKTNTSTPYLNIRTATLRSGKRINLNVLNKNGKKVKFSSSNKKTAIVNKKGYVTALRKGRAKITAKVGGKTLRCTVKVTTDPKLSAKEITVKKGAKASVNIIGKAKNIKNTYKNTEYAKVTSKRTKTKIKVKGLKKGKTELKIIVNKKTLKLKVRVRN